MLIVKRIPKQREKGWVLSSRHKHQNDLPTEFCHCYRVEGNVEDDCDISNGSAILRHTVTSSLFITNPTCTLKTALLYHRLHRELFIWIYFITEATIIIFQHSITYYDFLNYFSLFVKTIRKKKHKLRGIGMVHVHFFFLVT